MYKHAHTQMFTHHFISHESEGSKRENKWVSSVSKQGSAFCSLQFTADIYGCFIHAIVQMLVQFRNSFSEKELISCWRHFHTLQITLFINTIRFMSTDEVWKYQPSQTVQASCWAGNRKQKVGKGGGEDVWRGHERGVCVRECALNWGKRSYLSSQQGRELSRTVWVMCDCAVLEGGHLVQHHSVAEGGAGSQIPLSVTRTQTRSPAASLGVCVCVCVQT